MKRTMHTKDGTFEKEFSETELRQLAEVGDFQAKKELLKIELNEPSTIEEKFDKILKYLELK